MARPGMFGNLMYRELENVEILSIAFDERFTQRTHILVALNNEQAIQAYDLGYNVQLARKETRFLGSVVEEDMLYLVIQLPQRFGGHCRDLQFDGTKIIFQPGTMVNMGISVQTWMVGSKSGYTIYYEGVEFLKRPSWSIDAHLDSLMEKLQINEIIVDPCLPAGVGYLTNRQREEIERGIDYERYVQGQRDKCMPVVSRAQFERDQMKSRQKEREFENRRNRNKTYWNIGDVMSINGEAYTVGKIDDYTTSWMLRLDRKFKPSTFMRVPK